jgi:glutamate--cysteine ligase
VDEREALRRAVPAAGLTATFGGRPLRELASELVAIADAGLARLPGGAEDRPLLEPLRAYAAAGRSPADDLLDDYEAAGGDPKKLVVRWELRP